MCLRESTNSSPPAGTSLSGLTVTLSPAITVSGQLSLAESGSAVTLENVMVSLLIVSPASQGSRVFASAEAGGRLLEVVFSATAGRIGGTVTDKDGKPIYLATVAAVSSEAGTRVESANTDEAGRFAFDNLRPGTYKLMAWDDGEPGAWGDPEFRKPYESRATEIKAGPGETQTVVLHVIEQ